MYQMTIDDLLHPEAYKPNKRLHESSKYTSFYCGVCNTMVGMVDLETGGKWIYKVERCQNGHKVRWNNG